MRDSFERAYAAEQIPINLPRPRLSANNRGFTPLILVLVAIAACGPGSEERKALEEQLLTEAAVCNTPTVAKLLKKGARIDSYDNAKVTPLLASAFGGCTETLRLLLDSGASIEAAASDGSTALIYAAREGKQEAVAVLLDAGADPDAKDENGWTALMFASSGGHLNIIRSLVDAGAYINMRNYDGYTSLDLTGYVPPEMGETFWPAGKGIVNRPKASELLLKHGAEGTYSER